MINPTASEWRLEQGEKPRKRTRMFRFSMLSSLSVAAAMPLSVTTRINDEEVEPIDFDTDADVIGISFMTFNAPRAYEIADRFRKEKNKTVIFGGYHPTFMPDEAIKHADAICIGEAENNVPRMIQDFAAGKLHSFYRSGPVDLKGLRIPDRSLLRKSGYIMAESMQATRGCPNRCKFCSITAFYNHIFRARPVEDVVREVKTLGKIVIFTDDNMTAEPEYAKDLFAAMIPLKKLWFGQCGITIARDDELLRLASKSGCRGMFIGLESLSQENLADCQKNINTAREYRWAIGKIHSAGMGVYAGVVFGMDGDKPDVFEKTLDFLDRSKVDSIQATIMTPFPGTSLHDEMEKQGRIMDKDWRHYDFSHCVIDPKNMSPQTLKNGHDWILTKFYSQRSVLRRAVNAFGYLHPWVVLNGVLPINIGYRSRLRTAGVLRPELVRSGIMT